MQVIGRMGPIFQGVTARLLEAGAVVVAPSLNKAGLEELQNSLGQPQVSRYPNLVLKTCPLESRDWC